MLRQCAKDATAGPFPKSHKRQGIRVTDHWDRGSDRPTYIADCAEPKVRVSTSLDLRRTIVQDPARSTPYYRTSLCCNPRTTQYEYMVVRVLVHRTVGRVRGSRTRGESSDSSDPSDPLPEPHGLVTICVDRDERTMLANFESIPRLKGYCFQLEQPPCRMQTI